MKTLIAFLLLSASVQAGELHRLGAFLALEVASLSAAPAPAPAPQPPAPVGKVCPECAPDGVPLFPSHPGKVGDGSIFMDCPNENCPYKPAAPAPEPEPPKPSISSYLPPVPLVKAPQPKGPRWTVGNTHPDRASLSQIANHLRQAHGFDPAGMTRQDALDLHDSFHNSASQPARTTTRRSTSSCPTGTCPTR